MLVHRVPQAGNPPATQKCLDHHSSRFIAIDMQMDGGCIWTTLKVVDNQTAYEVAEETKGSRTTDHLHQVDGLWVRLVNI